MGTRAPCNKRRTWTASRYADTLSSLILPRHQAVGRSPRTHGNPATFANSKVIHVSDNPSYRESVSVACTIVRNAVQPVDVVVNFTLPDDILVAKLLGRRVCADCGRGYNVTAIHQGELDMPPLLPKPSDCDKCHGKPRLIVRDDDKEEIVRERLRVYVRQTAPLVEYYCT